MRPTGMDEAEYDYMRSAIGQRDALQYETPGNKLGLLGNIMRYDLPLNYRTQQANILRETDRETLNTLANELIQPDNMAIVIVGDEAIFARNWKRSACPSNIWMRMASKSSKSNHPGTCRV